MIYDTVDPSTCGWTHTAAEGNGKSLLHFFSSIFYLSYLENPIMRQLTPS